MSCVRLGWPGSRKLTMTNRLVREETDEAKTRISADQEWREVLGMLWICSHHGTESESSCSSDLDPRAAGRVFTEPTQTLQQNKRESDWSKYHRLLTFSNPKIQENSLKMLKSKQNKTFLFRRWAHFSPSGPARSCAPVWWAPRTERLWSGGRSKLRWRRRPPGCTFCPGTISPPPGIFQPKQDWFDFSLSPTLHHFTSLPKPNTRSKQQNVRYNQQNASWKQLNAT